MSTTKDLLNQALSHKTAIIKNVMAAIIMVAIFAFKGCFNFATMTWEWENLKNPTLWVNAGIDTALMLAVKSAMLLVWMDVARRLNISLFKAKRTNEEYMKKKGNDFPLYTEEELNPSIRVEEFKKIIKAKIIKLEHKAKPYDRALYFSDKETEKGINKYCQKRMALDYLLSDEYIEKNKDNLYVKDCPVVDPAIFDKPVTNEHNNKWQMSAKTKSAIAASMIFSAVWLVIVRAIWSAAKFDKLEDYNALEIWLNILMDAVFIIGNALMGVLQAFTTVNDQEVLPYTNRNRVLLSYVYWKNKGKEEDVKNWVKSVSDEIDKELVRGA